MEKAIQHGGLYGQMMRSIRTSHSIGNKIRMIKLPLIFTDPILYAGAISNFYWLTKTLEDLLDEQATKNPKGMIADLLSDLGLGHVSRGYESDLAELFGETCWRDRALSARTAATKSYCEKLRAASPVELVSATFILYGALVVGGGKATQRKVRKAISRCEHKLFDVAENIASARKKFKETFCKIGEKYPEHEEEFVSSAAKFMALNNTVVLSCRCLPYWWWKAAASGAIAFLAVKWTNDSLKR